MNKMIDIYAHCASIEPTDFENIQFETEVCCIEIGFPKSEAVNIKPVFDLDGLICEFKNYFEEWEEDESFQLFNKTDDYWIESIVLKGESAEFLIAA